MGQKMEHKVWGTVTTAEWVFRQLVRQKLEGKMGLPGVVRSACPLGNPAELWRGKSPLCP